MNKRIDVNSKLLMAAQGRSQRNVELLKIASARAHNASPLAEPITLPEIEAACQTHVNVGLFSSIMGQIQTGHHRFGLVNENPTHLSCLAI